MVDRQGDTLILTNHGFLSMMFKLSTLVGVGLPDGLRHEVYL